MFACSLACLLLKDSNSARERTSASLADQHAPCEFRSIWAFTYKSSTTEISLVRSVQRTDTYMYGTKKIAYPRLLAKIKSLIQKLCICINLLRCGFDRFHEIMPFGLVPWKFSYSKVDVSQPSLQVATPRTEFEHWTFETNFQCSNQYATWGLTLDDFNFLPNKIYFFLGRRMGHTLSTSIRGRP